MTLTQVRALGIALQSEGVERASSHGWLSGPLLVIVDDQDRVTTVSVELSRGAGVTIGRHRIQRTSSMREVQLQLGRCVQSVGSGGVVFTCANAAGHNTYAYGTFGSTEISIQLH